MKTLHIEIQVAYANVFCSVLLLNAKDAGSSLLISPCVTLGINAVVGCHYFAPAFHLPSHLKVCSHCLLKAHILFKNS